MPARRHIALGSVVAASAIGVALSVVRCPYEPPHARLPPNDARFPPANVRVVGDLPPMPDASIPDARPMGRPKLRP